MFGLFKKNPSEKLRKEHAKLMEDAMNAQRNGKIELYAELTQKAENLFKEIEELEKKKEGDA